MFKKTPDSANLHVEVPPRRARSEGLVEEKAHEAEIDRGVVDKPPLQASRHKVGVNNLTPDLNKAAGGLADIDRQSASGTPSKFRIEGGQQLYQTVLGGLKTGKQPHGLPGAQAAGGGRQGG